MTFWIAVSILRMASKFSGLQSWYIDWNWDFQDCSLDIETGIKTAYISIIYQDWYQDFKKTLIVQSSLVLRIFKLQSLDGDQYPDFDNPVPNGH